MIGYHLSPKNAKYFFRGDAQVSSGAVTTCVYTHFERIFELNKGLESVFK